LLEKRGTLKKGRLRPISVGGSTQTMDRTHSCKSEYLKSDEGKKNITKPTELGRKWSAQKTGSEP